MDDLHSRWSHRWLSPKAEARKSSIAGTGVFAKETISKGEVVGVLGGVIVPKSEIEEYRKLMTQVGIQVDENFFIVPTSRAELEAFGVFNHSCEPNIGFASSITFVAMRDIEQGEELLFDYAFCETAFDGFDCRCGTKSCRHKITREDWANKDLQRKYGHYFSPYLRNKISER
jgi:SET domain-containing protein